MNIYKKGDCFEVFPASKIDIEFIQYIKDANGILVTQNVVTANNKPYDVRAFRMINTNQMENKMKDGIIDG